MIQTGGKMVYFSINYRLEVVVVLKLFVAFSLTPIFPLRPVEAVYRFLIFYASQNAPGRSERPSNHDIIFAVKSDKTSALKCYLPFSLHAWVTIQGIFICGGL